MVMHVYNPSTWEAEAKLKASLGYIDPVSKRRQIVLMLSTSIMGLFGHVMKCTNLWNENKLTFSTPKFIYPNLQSDTSHNI
jgi:hypothetical protein